MFTIDYLMFIHVAFLKQTNRCINLYYLDMDDNSTTTPYAIKREENGTISVNFTTQCIIPKPEITLSCLVHVSIC